MVQEKLIEPESCAQFSALRTVSQICLLTSHRPKDYMDRNETFYEIKSQTPFCLDYVSYSKDII